jgi:hypothetical protein
MKYQSLKLGDVSYKWSVYQDGEHPDFVLVCDAGEIGIQVEISQYDQEHNKLYHKGKVYYPISNTTALKVVNAIIEKGYLKKYFESDVGLIFTEKQCLIEN